MTEAPLGRTEAKSLSSRLVGFPQVVAQTPAISSLVILRMASAARNLTSTLIASGIRLRTHPRYSDQSWVRLSVTASQKAVHEMKPVSIKRARISTARSTASSLISIIGLTMKL